MKKYSKRLLALLLACIMVLACGATAFADEIDVEAPLSVEKISYNSYVVPSYEYVYKIQVPCSGTVTFTAKLQEKAADDYAARMFLYNEIPNYMVGEPVNDFYITSETTTGTKNISVTKGTYYLRGYAPAASKIKYTFKSKAASVSSVKNSASKTITVKWKKVSGVTGYQIQYSTKSDFSSQKTVTVKKASTVSTKIKSLKKGMKYYVRVRSYVTIDGKKCCSEWSAKKAVKITK